MALVALVLTAFSLAAPAAYAALAPDNSAATQVLTWTAGDGYMGYTSAPTTAVAGPATIVFENSAATGNTTGMPHTLTFDTSNPDYNTDVSLNIQASPSDSSSGRHTAEVTLTPGVYHYYCAMPGHMMSGELTVTAAPGDDTTAPDTSASVSGTKDASGDYVDSATVTLSASDSGSGVDTIEYALDGAAYATYTDPVRVSGVGRHTLAYRATDKAGNTSAVKSVSFAVVAAPPEDTTPPETSATVSGTKDASGDYVSGATVTVTASDTGSGVAGIEYALDGGAYRDYTAPVLVSDVGRHTLAYRATDKAGNTSAVKSVSFTVVAAPPEDTTPPETSATVSGTKDASGDYVSGATVTVTASDTGSGVAGIEYALDGGAYRDYTAPVLVSDVGRHTLAYRATDKAGNTSAAQTVSFTVVAAPPQDTTPPEVSASVSGTKDASGNYVGGATVTVTASDSGSGVAATEYSLDGGPYLPYSAPVAVDRAGSHTFLYRATDKAGNTSAAKSLTLTVVDSKPPTNCPETDDRSTVFAGTLDTGIPNRVTTNGCTINELIEDHRAWASHGAFVSHVEKLVADLRHQGVVDQREAGDIKKAAGRCDVGKVHSAHTER
ncbi:MULTISPECIES: OmpL47-type beta-barrel domain-containing protein [unclassified Streptomyces]|uniref:OmpL47-type beta-barrel domain-containing protein n=1 Tax=unclassified Streptomyces TaxID=2593676 RepID=UPI0040434DDA